MKKTRLFALLLVLVLVVSAMAGCGKKEEAPETTTKAPETTTAAPETTTKAAEDTTTAAVEKTLADLDHDAKIGMTVKNANALFYTSLINGAKRAIEEINKEYGRNHELIVLDDQTELANELTNVDDLINMGCDFIIFVPIDPSSSVAACEKILESNAHCIIIDAPCDVADKCDAVIVSDNFEAGRMQMEKLCEKLGGKGDIVLINDSTNPNAKKREEGAKEELKNWPDINVLEYRDIKSSVENAMAAVEDMLNVYADEGIDGIWNFSDTPGQGSVSVVQSRGLGDKIVVTGIDGNKTAKQLIADGQMYGSAAQFPNELGYKGVYAGLNLLIGIKPEQQTELVPVEWIDATNVADYQAWDQ
ncbi:MAG: sugar ABC transporter substrate-binding protein [Lachnospiraceae bacterium]|nr:sugar ABC transporter substrate-binding protein [Lachnospiraceae bacterium]